MNKRPFLELVKISRSFRRFDQNCQIEGQFLEQLVEIARLTPSAANLQSLKYFLSGSRESNNRIFPLLKWAGYLEDWPGPQEGERPAAYIVILGDTRIAKSFDMDVGIVAQSMKLAAMQMDGVGCCMIVAFNRKKLGQELKLPKYLTPLLVLALGKPVEDVVLETTEQQGDIKYWRDKEGKHHVPKRSLQEIIWQEKNHERDPKN